MSMLDTIKNIVSKIDGLNFVYGDLFQQNIEIHNVKVPIFFLYPLRYRVTNSEINYTVRLRILGNSEFAENSKMSVEVIHEMQDYFFKFWKLLNIPENFEQLTNIGDANITDIPITLDYDVPLSGLECIFTLTTNNTNAIC